MFSIFEKVKKAYANPALVRHRLEAKIARHFAGRQYSSAEANRSISDDGMYVRFVERANRNFNVFKTFKLHPHYRAVLEHVSAAQGAEYLRVIAEDSPDLRKRIDNFKINDLVGSPIVASYPEVGAISPTTLRYLNVASNIRNIFGDLSGATVAEIGVGYGGQLLVLDQIYKFHRYDLFDLFAVLELASRYLENHILNSSYRTSTLNQSDGSAVYDLVISNYAFSEFPYPLQRKYLEKVISKARRGYLTMNTGRAPSPNKVSLDELRTLLPSFEVLEERPLTRRDNYIIVWGRNVTAGAVSGVNATT